MKKIKLIEVSSDLGGKKAGASLGMDAIRIASYTSPATKEFYRRFENNLSAKIIAPNNFFHLPYMYSAAKRIESIYPIYKKTCEEVANSIKQNDFTIIISGDHSTAGGTIAGIKQAIPTNRIGIVWIDAHADVHTPYTTCSGDMHGMPLGTAINDDNMDSKINDIDDKTADAWCKLQEVGGRKDKVNMSDIVYIAVRDYEQAEENLIKKYNTKVYSAANVKHFGATETAKKIIKDLSDCDIIYISFDVDSMDKSISVGTGTPVENGLFEHEAKELLKTLVAYDKVKCLEFSEINPLLDTENKTAKMIFDFMQSICEIVDLS